MKVNARLDYDRLADALIDRGLLDREAARLVLQQVHAGGTTFCEVLVTENLVSDWEVAKVSSEIFGLPFLPLDVAPPNPRLIEEFDKEFLRLHGIVPVERFGSVLTVAMPGMVPSSVLSSMSSGKDIVVSPVIGLVQSNRAWLNEHIPHVESIKPLLPGESGEDAAWASVFDAGDEAVQLNLEEEVPRTPGSKPRKIVLDDLDFS